MVGLVGHGRQGCSPFLGFDYADGVAVNDEQIVAAAGIERYLAQSDTATSRQIHRFVILHDPPGGDELSVDLLAGFGFWCHEGQHLFYAHEPDAQRSFAR